MTAGQLSSDTGGPFGSPDASRADAPDEYIPVAGTMPDLSDLTGRLRERIIVGKKGAGKTLYLKSLQRRMLQDIKDGDRRAVFEAKGWVVVREIQALSSQDVINFARSSQRAHAQLARLNVYVDQAARTRDLWTRVWECAILAAVLNLILHPGSVKSLNECKRKLEVDTDISAKMRYIEPLLSGLAPSVSPVTHIKEFLAKFSKRSGDIRDFVDQPAWNILHEILSAVVPLASQIAIFIDSIDDEFEEAPEPWLDCQEGLFRAIFSILNKSDPFSNRVHVIVALREIVFSSLLNSEHASRFLWDEHVHYIAWDVAASRAFLIEKIKGLDQKYLTSESSPTDDPLVSWLGFRTVTNVARGTVEAASTYILRHTRLVPRDIVLMGNAVSHAIRRRRAEQRRLSEGKLRQVVHEVARQVAQETILSCANEYISSVDYVAEVLLSSRKRQTIASREIEGQADTAALEQLADVDVTEVIEQIKGHVVHRISDFILSIGHEKFDRRSLQDGLVKADLANEEDFSKAGRAAFSRFDNIMYRHGIIAFQKVESGAFRWKFSWRDSPTVENSQLPGNETYYGFHSCILDAFPGVKRDSRGPVF